MEGGRRCLASCSCGYAALPPRIAPSHGLLFRATTRRIPDLFEARRFPEDPTVYVSAPSRSDRSLVPGEGEALFIMANAPANDQDEWNDDDIRSGTRPRAPSACTKEGFPEISQDIAIERGVDAPAARTALHHAGRAAIYGTIPTAGRNAFLRRPTRTKHYRGSATSWRQHASPAAAPQPSCFPRP